MSTRVVVVAVLLAGTGTAAVALWLRSADSADQGATASPRTRHVFREGERRVFGLRCHSRMRTELARVAPGKGLATRASEIGGRIDVEGAWTVTTLEASDAGVLLAVGLRGARARVAFRGSVAAGALARLEADLAGPAFAELAPDGRVRALRLDPALAQTSQGILRALAAATQVVLGGDSSWTAEEEDTNGRYLARYSLQAAAGDVLELVKRKERYLRERPRPGDEPRADVTFEPDGALRVRFDAARGHVLDLDGVETVRTRLAGTAVGVTRTELRLAYAATETPSAAELAGLRRRAEQLRDRAAPLFVEGLTPAAEEALHRQQLGAATAGELLDRLARADSMSAEDRALLGLKLRSLAYLHPDECARLSRVLAAAEAGSATMSVLGEALALAGHEAAQWALVSAVRARWRDGAALLALVPLFATLPRPITAVEEVLRELSTRHEWDVATTAQLALGALARRSARAAPERARRIVAWSTERLEAAPSPQWRRQWLLVLGNAGARESLPVLRRFAADGPAAVRGAALWAMRWIDDPLVDELLVGALRGDADPGVRLEALRALALRQRSAGALDAMKAALSSDPEEDVRAAALDRVWELRDADPEVVEVVRRAARADPSASVRKQAARRLDGVAGLSTALPGR